MKSDYVKIIKSRKAKNKARNRFIKSKVMMCLIKYYYIF